jgi:hypothetical protein
MQLLCELLSYWPAPSAQSRPSQEFAMKADTPVREPEPSPSKNRVTERPDNGSKTSRGQGPSSGAQKHNPHKQLELVGHGWLKR